ncbi:MAG: cytidine deaminase [Endomicrobiales bacterium]|nr:cytidine deaminase [Endomicrobiales bacterium]
MKTKYKELLEEARKARKKAYSPYSKLKVGAAVLTDKGNIYTGVNAENASFGLTNCAERTAIYNALSCGEKKFKAVAVFSDKPGIAPCGACRQVIYEFGSDIDVIFRKNSKNYTVKKISELLPDAFRFGRKKR